MTAAPVRAYVDHPVTDLDAAQRAAAVAAHEWALEPPVLLRAGMNVIFGCGDGVVVRVGEPSVDASAAIDLAGFLAGIGIRVAPPAVDAVVTVDAMQVTAWRRIAPTAAPLDWRAVGAMVRRLHGVDPADLPSSVPLPRPEHLPWWDLDALLDRVGADIDGPARSGLERAVARHGRWWDGVDRGDRVVCHGDIHPGNVMMSADGAVVIDWDLLCWGPPGWDHGPMLTWASRWGGRAGEYEAFAAGYGRSFADDRTTIALAELRLVAATLLRLEAARRDRDALAEAELRLRYWRGEPDAPMWTAQ